MASALATNASRLVVPFLGTFFIVKNAEGINLYVSEISRATLHFLSRPTSSSSSYSMETEANQKLNDVQHLLTQLYGQQNAWIVLPSKASLVYSIGTLVLFAGAVYVSGNTFNDVMYVTKSNFKRTTDALREGIQLVAEAVSKVRLEVMEKLGVVEKKVDDVHDIVEDLQKRLATIEGGLTTIEGGLNKANRGIHLLCGVVVEGNTNTAFQNSKSFKELYEFTGPSMMLPQQNNNNEFTSLKIALASSSSSSSSKESPDNAAGFHEKLASIVNGSYVATTAR